MYHWFLFIKHYLLIILIGIAVIMTGCELVSTNTPTATPQPTATPTQVVVALNVTLSPNETDVIFGEQVALVSDFEVITGVTVRWRVEPGGSGGILNVSEGLSVIYTAGSKQGVDIVTIEAVLEDGTVADSETITFKVTLPTATPTPTSTSTATHTPTNTPTATFTRTPTTTPWPTQIICLDMRSLRASLSSPPAEGGGLIQSPENCTMDIEPQPASIDVYGTYSSEFDGMAFWVLVYIEGLYYPQASSTPDCQVVPTSASRGLWTASFVGLGASNKQFDIVLIVTEPGREADNTFTEWVQTGCEADSFPGIPADELPPDLIELYAVTVHTR